MISKIFWRKTKRKAQFFIITSVLIISALFVTSRVFQEQYTFKFNEIKRFGVSFNLNNLESNFLEAKKFRTIDNEPCSEEKELSKMVKKWAFEKGYIVNITLSGCDKIKIKSLYFNLEKEIC